MQAKREVEIRIDRHIQVVMVSPLNRRPGINNCLIGFGYDFENEFLRKDQSQVSLLQAIEKTKKHCVDNKERLEEPRLSEAVQYVINLSN